MGIRDSIKKPVETGDDLPDLGISTGHVDGYMTSAVFERSGTRSGTLHFLQVVFGGNSKVAVGLTEALRANSHVQGTLLYILDDYRWDSVLRKGIEFKRRNKWNRAIFFEKAVREALCSDVIPLSKRETQLTIYPASSKIGSTENTYTLIMPYTWTEQQMQEHVFWDINDRCGSLCIAREWVWDIWQWMVQVGYITQYDAFGHYVGFSVRYDEPKLREFVSRELRRGTIQFPDESVEEAA